MAALRCTVVTPTESVLESEATYVELPAWDGQKGVATGAAPFLVKLGQGRLRVEKTSGGSEIYLLEGGFAQMNGGLLTVLADSAVTVASINAATAETELAAANADAGKLGTLEERDQAERRQRLAYARVAQSRSGTRR